MRTPTGETPFKLAYGSEAVIPVEVHIANHKVMTYQEKDNEEQLRLSLHLIDEVRMDVEHRTVRYKNLMARQHDAMVKPRCFNIGDLVLKRVSLATKNPAHGKLGRTLQSYQLQKTRILLLGNFGQEEIGTPLEC